MFTIKRFKIITLTAISILAIYILIFFSNDVIAGINNGINISIKTLVPSLFPFIVLSCFIVLSNSYIYIGYLFLPLTKFIFKIPSFLGSIIFISLIGGFPIGAKNIVTLYEQQKISKKTANALLSFCVNAGPSFLITGVGIKMFNSYTVGLYIFLSSTLASLILGVFMMRINNDNYNNLNVNKNNSNLSYAFCESVNIAVKSMTSICSYVIVFCCIIELVNKILFNNNILNAFIYSIIEVTYSCNFLSYNLTGFPFLLLCFSTSFCGLSIIFQIKHILKNTDLSLKYFYILRIPHFILNYIIFITLITLTPIEKTVFSPSDIVVTGVNNNSFYGFLFLCLAIISLLYYIENFIQKIKK